MEYKIEVFNGSEHTPADSKYLAIHQFYKAFNNRSIELMSENWSQSESILMANPIGGLRNGWIEIMEGYKKIFSSKHQVYVELYDYQMILSDQMFVINGRERGFLKTEFERMELHIRTTRIYRLEESKWKQVVHHGSIDDPMLLGRYQKIILNK